MPKIILLLPPINARWPHDPLIKVKLLSDVASCPCKDQKNKTKNKEKQNNNNNNQMHHPNKPEQAVYLLVHVDAT